MDPGQAQARQQIHASPFTSVPQQQLFSQDGPPRSTPMLTMNDNEVPVTSESMEQHTGMWMTPSSQGLRPRPATIHEGFTYPIGEDYGAHAPWDSSTLHLFQFSNDAISRPGSVQSSFHQPQGPYGIGLPGVLDNSWMQKPGEDNLEFPLEPNMAIGQAFTTDEAIAIQDIKFPHRHQDGEAPNNEDAPRPRRMSGSSFTMSTSGALSDIPSEMPSYDDFSTTKSDTQSFSDYRPTSNRNSLMSCTQLSPVVSPRVPSHSRTELVRTQSRGRASPSPRPGVRSAPYSIDGPRNKRWSTGSYGTTPQRHASPFAHHQVNNVFSGHQMHLTASPTAQHDHAALNFTNLQAIQQPSFMVPNVPHFSRNTMYLPSQGLSQGFHPQPQNLDNPPTLMSQNSASQSMYRLLSSHGDHHALHGFHHTEMAEPPDLYASIYEDQIPPPPEDMNPSDPDLVPHEQELRFEGDLYTPRWVRGQGNKREGWCGICKPGRWLVLKNSAYWYDKSFTHGISAATGAAFHHPLQTRRMDGNPDVWEGLCGTCNEWIALVSSKKKGTTWFRHAYKCHTHPKIKDGPKRRRDTSASRVLPPAQMAKPHGECQAPLTPQMTPAALSTTNTPTPGQMQQHSHFHLMARPPSSHTHQENMRNMMSSPLSDMTNMI